MNHQEAIARLHDIKPPLEVPDISFYLLLLALLLAFLAFGLFVWYVMRLIKNKKSPPPKKLYLQELKNIDFKNPKESAYKITKYGALLASDDQTKAAYNELVRLLERYKYKKEVPEIAPKVISQYTHFVGLIHV